VVVLPEYRLTGFTQVAGQLQRVFFSSPSSLGHEWHASSLQIRRDRALKNRVLNAANYSVYVCPARGALSLKLK